MAQARTQVTLVTARLAAVREAAVAARIDPASTTAVLAEGLPGGHDPFERFAGDALVHIVRLAPGCPCCLGNLPLRVSLNRLLRLAPDHLYFAIAPTSHVSQLCAWLSQPPYDTLLTLNSVINADNEG